MPMRSPRCGTAARRAFVAADGLASDVVQLWQWDLDAAGAGGDADRAVLSDEERARADRFVVASATRRFTAGRARLRNTLASVVGGAPAALPVMAGPNGKPYLPGGPEFNLSHSGPVALFGVAPFPLGVDVEHQRPIEPGVADLVFTASELAEWRAAGQAAGVFYRGWTRKEAVLKALGRTLAEMKSVTVALGHPGVLRGEPAWQIADVALVNGYAAAVAAPCRGWRLEWAAGPVRV